MAALVRKLPNILITGTPGTGKTRLSAEVADRAGLQHLLIGQVVKDNELHSGYDAEFDTLVMDEDKLCDYLEPLMGPGGKIVDYHGCDFFPERWFDLVVVLQTDNTVLYDRLAERGYQQNKISENVACEIMQVILEQAQDSYAETVILLLKSDTVGEFATNVEAVIGRVQSWVPKREAVKTRHMPY